MRLPIFQVAYGFHEENFGFLFPAEIDYEPQYFTYAIPLPICDRNGRPDYTKINDALQGNDFYFPAEVNGEYMEFAGKFEVAVDFSNPSGNMITFMTNNQISVHFEVDIYAARPFYRTAGLQTRNINKYVGRYNTLFLQRSILIPLVIKDIKSMNQFFLKNKGIFVGYTYNFGEFEENN